MFVVTFNVVLAVVVVVVVAVVVVSAILALILLCTLILLWSSLLLSLLQCRHNYYHYYYFHQDHFDKMSSSIGDLEDQLMQAKQALEARVKTSTRLEERLMKMDAELKRYRERFGKLEKQNKRLSELVKNEKGTRNESQENENTTENVKVKSSFVKLHS